MSESVDRKLQSLEDLPVNGVSMETPEIPELMSSKDFAPSNFSQVVFPQISDYFPPGKDVLVTYLLTEALEPSYRDWMGLFKVGWTSAREYLTFVWAPKLNSSQHTDRTITVIFSAYYLPTDKNEFYQFCYVTRQGHIRGASTPFQFREPSDCDQLIEVEDESGMIVLKTKATAMQENFDQLMKEKVELEVKIVELDQENTRLARELETITSDCMSLKKRDVEKEDERMKLEVELKCTIEKLEDVTTKLETVKKTMSIQKEELTVAVFAIAKLTKETLSAKEDLLETSNEHKKEMSTLNSQLDDKMSKLTEMECEMKDLTEKLRATQITTNDLQQKGLRESAEIQESTATLKIERDNAEAKALQYKEEKDLFKDQFTRSEEARQGIMQQLGALKRKLHNKEAEIGEKEEKILVYEEKTKMLKNELRNAEKQVVVQKSAVENELSNIEDKLNACEASKRLITNELTEARDHRDKLMSELHQAKKEKDQVTRDQMALKRQLSELEKNYIDMKERTERGEQRLAEKESKLVNEKIFTKERERELLGQIDILKSQLESADMAVATAASTSVTEKYESSTQTMSSAKLKKAEDLVTVVLKTEDDTVNDLKLQIEDLRTRLSMGAAAYTEKYMECHKLERKMKKLQIQKTSPKAPAPAQCDSLQDSTTSDSQDDSKQGKSQNTDPEKSKQEEVIEQPPTGRNFMAKLEQLFMAIADPDVEEQEQSNRLKARMQELEKSLQFQHAKYKKYKQLYLEEKISHASDYEKTRVEALALKSELNDLKTGKDFLNYENEALKEQLKEFVKSSKDENVAKTLVDASGVAEPTPPDDAIISRYGNPYEDETPGTTSHDKYPHENLYTDSNTNNTLGDSSESDLSDEFHLASARFVGLGLCPKNQLSDDSDPIEISRPPNDSPGDAVIKRQPTRSPPLIEVISEDLSTSPDAQDHNANTRVRAVGSSDKSGPRRRRGTKLKKIRARPKLA